MDHTVPSAKTEPVISSTDEIIEEECLKSKTVEDEDRILIDTNYTIDLGKIIVNEVKRDTLTRDQIYRYFKHQKTPSENEDLFKKQVAKAGKTFVLRFKHKWLKENSWHVYSKELKEGLCKACILFYKTDEINGAISVKRTYQDLKKPEKILEHTQTKYHNDAMICAQQFIDSYENPTENIDYDPNMQTRYDKNIQILMRIIDAVLICARYGIALRTNRDNLADPFVSDSNFIATLKGFANMDDTLKNHLDNGPKNAKMCSGQIQNEIIAYIARFV